ncbi:hypothetical protein HDU85_003733 [Gaertneriomyces sp. JEL0708]|nr:hypothetical protein HDU85_003733 [Gaertneriomyces sp. JEL0708]
MTESASSNVRRSNRIRSTVVSVTPPAGPAKRSLQKYAVASLDVDDLLDFKPSKRRAIEDDDSKPVRRKEADPASSKTVDQATNYTDDEDEFLDDALSSLNKAWKSKKEAEGIAKNGGKNKAGAKRKRTNLPASQESTSSLTSIASTTTGSIDHTLEDPTGLKIPGEGVLARGKNDKRYYPARVIKYDPQKNTYQIEYATWNTSNLRRHEFFAVYEKPFRHVELGEWEVVPPTKHSQEALREEIQSAIEKVVPVVTDPVHSCPRRDKFLGGYRETRELEKNVHYGPFGTAEVDRVLELLTSRFWGNMGEQDLTPRAARALRQARLRFSSPPRQDRKRRVPKPLPEDGNVDVNAPVIAVKSACLDDVMPALHSHLQSPAQRDHFTRLVLLPETLIQVLILRAEEEDEELSYEEAEAKLLRPARSEDWIDEIMTARQCAVAAEQARRR